MKFKVLVLITLLSASPALAQEKNQDRDILSWGKTSAIEDRAAGTHNAGNIGLFFENRGKLYPRRLSQGPSGEFPINSGKHYIYRINPMVGLPGNVIQGRYTDNEEWEAVGGYHNSDYTKMAFSDNDRTWPSGEWPVRDTAGNPVILSDQDSYCVYDDANNSVKKLNIQVAQTGYAFGVKFAQNILFYKYEITSSSGEDLDSLYFNLYCDIDIGNISGGAPEYADDKVGFSKERNLLWFYDTGYSSEWPGNKTGQFGIALLRTPQVNGTELGVTDMHYNREEHDIDRDDIQYALMSGDTSFLGIPELFGNFFHTGQTGNLHFDDLSTIPSSGLGILANISSGPYQLNHGDTLTFYTALIGAENNTELLETHDMALKILNLNFNISKPPASPVLSAVPGDGKVTLFWDDLAEASVDNFSGEQDFEGYRLYRSVDQGVHWDQHDRNADPSVGVDPVPIADYDVSNERGLDSGLRYSFIDSTVINGFNYWYTVTSYDRGDTTLESLESARGNNIDAKNLAQAIPSAAAIDRTPVSSSEVVHSGSGLSNYQLNIRPPDLDSLQERTYDVHFGYTYRKDHGRLKTRVNIEVTDSSKTLAENYQIKFTSTENLYLINLTTDLEIGTNPKRYRSGAKYTLNPGLKVALSDDPNAPAEDLPKAGDVISINFSTFARRDGQDTVVAGRPLSLNQPMTTTDGVTYTLQAPEQIKQIVRVSGSEAFNLEFSVSDESLLLDEIYFISVTGSGFEGGKGFIGLLVQNAALDTVLRPDSLFNQDSFEFNGLSVQVSFPDNQPPGTGNIFSVETVVPRQPNIQDRYSFSLKGSVISKQQLSTKMKNIKAVPNPYLVSSLYEEEFGELRYEPVRQMRFINLPSKCTIHIFSVAGERIKKIDHEATEGSATWDLRSDGGREIAPGIYIYVVKSGSDEFLGRFAVIK